MNRIGNVVKSASTPETGVFVTLCGLFKAQETGALPRGAVARRLRLTVMASLCGLACVLVAAAFPAWSGAFGTSGSVGVAVDSTTGDVYVPYQFGHQIDKYDSAGNSLFSWGGEGPGAGTFNGEGPQAVAVDDNDPLSDFSAGDVYVADWGYFRVEKYNSEGKFLSMFGGEVNETKDGTPGATAAEKDVCLATEKCTAGAEGTGNGEFEWAYDSHGILAVGPGGAVYVGDRARVEVFEASGAWKENISLAGLSSEGKVTSLAVNTAGDVFVKDQGVAGVHEFEPDGVEMQLEFDEGSESVEAITLDPSGDVFIADSSGGLHVLKYSPAGKELESFESSDAASKTRGIALSDAFGKEALYVSYESGELRILAVPPAGPSIESESATPKLRGAATFEATVDPEGEATTYHFEYVDEADFLASGFADASSTTAAPIGSSFENQHAEASLPAKTLTPGVTYRWRVVAINECETGKTCAATGEERSLPEEPAVRVEGPWAADVASTSATLAARIDPLGASTEYRLEWGTSTAYGHVLSGSVGEGIGYVPISFHLQDLEAHTTYHYRLVVTNEVGTLEGADHVFTTQLGGAELTLPDGRAWELVSPANKKGALLQPLASFHTIQAAAGGGAIVYESSDAIGENPVGKSNLSEILSERGPSGWRSEDISTPRSLPPEGTGPVGAEGGQYALFSSNLSVGLIELGEPSEVRPLSPQATERTPYLRNDSTCGSQPQTCYTPLVTPADVEPPSVHFGGVNVSDDVNIAGGSPDLSHIVLRSPYALVAGAVTERTPTSAPENLYEWSGGRLQLVNVLPNGESRPGAHLGYLNGATGEEEVTAHSISSDGRRIVWSFGQIGGLELFVRDMDAKKTVKIGGASADFQTMSSDGSRIFFRENGDLYELNVGTEVQTDLTANHGSGEADAGVQDAILGSSEEGCDVGAAGECNIYFVAKGVLAGANVEGRAPVGGDDNLYVLHDGAGGWSTTYIATLSSEDEHSWYANTIIYEEEDPCDCRGVEHAHVSSRVSSNGRYVTFMSNRSLTGYDNTDAVSGQPDEEVYLYDAVAERLVCASCNPTGARPVGVLDGHQRLLVDPQDVWGARGEEGATAEGEHWLAGIIPSWWSVYEGATRGGSLYQPRSLSDAGRLFFDSPDALVPQAANGLMDVYEYEPSGSGSCTPASSTFSERSNGCVSLISGGTSSQESSFYDASESGDDVFFITASRLVPVDYDASYDVYDAHVCAAGAPCTAAPVSPPPCTSGDSCKAAPSPQPETFGAPASATFSGAGNLVEEVKSATVKPKAKKPMRHAKHKKRHKAKKARKSSRDRKASAKGGKR
jgi:hypothetical protein